MSPELVVMLPKIRNGVVLALGLFMKQNFLSMFWDSLDAK